MSFVATAVAVVSTGASLIQGKKASKNQARANEEQRKINRLKNEQAKRAFLRNFRQTQATNMVATIGRGVGLDSSGYQGTAASEVSQRNLAIKEFNELNQLGAAAAAFSTKAAQQSYQSQAYGTIGSIASSFAGDD